jgi:autoinducer 2-degrading protein
MYIVHVFIKVKPAVVEDFITASIANATNSLKEPGVARFDLIQESENPTHFVLEEIYYTPEDAEAHKQTSHYKLWRETVEPMMAEPRSRIVFQNIHPEDKYWR